MPFVITEFPGDELQLDSGSPYPLQCVVTVDEQFPLTAVNVSIRYSPISLDGNMPSEVYINKERFDENKRTLTVRVVIQDIERKFGGVYECNAMSKPLEHVIPHYATYNRTRLNRASSYTDGEL